MTLENSFEQSSFANPFGASLRFHHIVRIIGSGGMGSVYEAWDTRLDRRVALKILHPHITLDPSNKDRLVREARLAARVEHPGVVRVYGIQEHDGLVAMEMEFVDGTPLNSLLSLKRLTPAQVVDLLRQALEALVACHTKGVIHGDLKPANLMVTAHGCVVVTDFGIARAAMMCDESTSASLTFSKPLWGTPQYSPPEAWDGALPNTGWDLYALGMVAYEALCGRVPYNTQTPARLMHDKLRGRLPSILEVRGDLSKELANLIDSLISSDPGLRPSSAEAALLQLRRTSESREYGGNTQLLQHTPEKALSSGAPPSGFTFFRPNENSVQAPQRKVIRWSYLYAGIVTVSLIALAVEFARHRSQNENQAILESAVTPAGGVGEILELSAVGTGAYFSYDDGFRGRELWYALPSGKAEILADINPGPGSSNPTRFFTRDKRSVFFAATNAESGEELWFSSNNDKWRPVWMVRDILPGPLSSEPEPVAVWGESLMFYATTLFHGAELWLTTTRDKQTALLTDLHPGDGSSRHNVARVCADSTGAYIVAMGLRSKWGLWRYEHADASISSLGPADSDTGEMVIMNNSLFLAMGDPEHGGELWVYRPGDVAAQLLIDIYPGPDSSLPQQFFVWHDHLYFQAKTKEHGSELWRSDGSADGTVELANIGLGFFDGAPYDFVPTDEYLFFRATNEAHGNELWITDGSPGGTRLLFDLRPGPDSSNPYNIATIGRFLFFTADDGVHGEELSYINLQNIDAPPKLVADLWPGPTGAEPHDLMLIGAELGIFVYKTDSGSNLMQILIDRERIELKPYTGLPQVEAR